MRKSIRVEDTWTNEVKVFRTTKEAAEYLKTGSCQIRNCINRNGLYKYRYRFTEVKNDD